MNKAIEIKQVGQLDIVSLSVPYTADPTRLFQALCSGKQNSLLLESADIDSKQDLKSMLLIDAALRIECNGNQVTFSALSDNGRHALTRIAAHAQGDVGIEQTDSQLLLTFTPANPDLDEDSKLREASSFDALRLVQHSFKSTQQDADAEHDFSLFLAGLFAFDLVANFEPLGEAVASNQCPDYVFYLAETLMTIDHQQESCFVQGTVFDGTEQTKQQISYRLKKISELSTKPAPLEETVKLAQCEPIASVSDEAFCQTVTDLKEFVVKGDVFQVVPSRRFTLPCPSPLASYQKLKQNNPSPYMFYMNDELFTLFGASPESALKYDTRSNQVEIYPIAGTRHRGKNADGSINPDLDGRIELELRSDKKENAEHMMLVDLARNDVARISAPGTRHIADLLKVDRYSHVMHLVSRVVGQLRPDLDALHAYQACMNMGTLTGAPKIRAMQLIRDVEKQRRGSYGGAVGYLTGRGDLDSCIVIRSAYVENGVAQVQAGAGVVYDSDPQAEADETRGKAQAVISAIQAAHKE
ncbi:anthranilate synthase component 1 [Vibrio sp. SCSIO 43137]|uniref:anthranilate synthase component 1 n=1 Tax=Vibrio sp. SCSIO 43137 TaxID=3021011 RepID=UPI00230728A0|nr:anthranilate synthase component 1 [Vibrio sp. SCSIO 43137]WCE28510.1 anthranilate synthase component 1 [Vibrio sp. SCSIO 43137]